MTETCRALLHIPAALDRGTGQIICDLPMGHDGALHFDERLSLWWMRLVPGPRVADVPNGIRMNEDMTAALQREWT